MFAPLHQIIRYGGAALIALAALLVGHALTTARFGADEPSAVLMVAFAPAAFLAGLFWGFGPAFLVVGSCVVAVLAWGVRSSAGLQTSTLILIVQLLEVVALAVAGALLRRARHGRWPVGASTPVNSPAAAQNHSQLETSAQSSLAPPESELYLHQLIDANIFGVTFGNFDGTITAANDYFLNMLGYTPEELDAGVLRWDALSPPEWLPRDEIAAQELHSRGVAAPFEKECLRKDGTRVPILTGGFVAPGGGMGRGQIVTFYLNLTDRNRAEESRARLAAIVESSDDAIVGKTLDGIITSWNRAAERIFGHTSEQVVGKHISTIVPPDRLDDVQTILTRLRRGERIDHHETQRVHRDGHRVDVSLTVSPIRDSRGVVVGASKIARDITDRKRRESELAQANDRFRLAAEAVNALVYEWDLQNDQMIHSRGLQQIAGYDPADAQTTHRWWTQLIHPEDLDAVRAMSPEKVRTRGMASAEYRICHKSGEWRTVWDRVIAITEPVGEPMRAVGAIIDVTDRKRAEMRVRASEERFRALLNATTSIVWQASPEGAFTQPQPSWERFTGQTFSEYTGWGWSDAVHPEDRARTLKQWNDHRRSEGVYENQHRLRRHDGSWRQVMVRAAPVHDSDGNVREWVGMCNDITESARTEAALREETQTLATINSIGRTLVAELDLQTIVQSVTDAATQVCGAQFGAFFYNVTGDDGESYSLYTLSGVPREAFSKFPMPRNTEVFGPTFSGEGVVRSGDITQDPRYGKNAPYHGMPEGHLPVRSYLAVPVVSRTGKVIGGLFFGHSAVGVFNERDEQIVSGIAAQAAIAIDNAQLYSDAQRARQAAERANRMKDEFLATLSHELRTPLNAILGWAQLLRGGRKDETDFQTGLETIERNARVQARLIDDLLDMSRIISGRVQLDVQPVEWRPLIEAAIETVRPAADAKQIQIERTFDSHADIVHGDPHRLQQVAWNLLSNAIKFSSNGGRVNVLLHRDANNVEFTVRDNGIGISPHFLPHVFDRFRQADASTTRKHYGLGLGLSIVRQLVELHGGTVRAESAGPGLGATFIVRLPVASVPGPEPNDQHQYAPVNAGSRSTAASGPSLTGVRVLVVDDESDARDLVRRLLEVSGADVSTASSAAEAMGIVEKLLPDVLLSDIGMPDEDGYALIRKLRQLPANRGGRIPAAALTAFARMEDRTRAMLSGFQVHIPKPVEPSELIAVVASLAGRVGRPDRDPESNLAQT